MYFFSLGKDLSTHANNVKIGRQCCNVFWAKRNINQNMYQSDINSKYQFHWRSSPRMCVYVYVLSKHMLHADWNSASGINGEKLIPRLVSLLLRKIFFSILFFLWCAMCNGIPFSRHVMPGIGLMFAPWCCSWKPLLPYSSFWLLLPSKPLLVTRIPSREQ